MYNKCGDQNMKEKRVYQKNGYILRLTQKEDALEYYENNFNPIDPEIVRLTGSQPFYTKDEVINFFINCIDAKDRYDFILIDPEGHIVGESVINQIDSELKSANFRIAMFHPQVRNQGIGTWMINQTLSFAFDVLKLHRVSLDVFSFNKRAIHTYEKVGFKQEGVLRDGIKDGNQYADDILMSILEDEWRKLKSQKHS